MTNNEEIIQLQQQLDLLKKQFNQQHQQILMLQQRLNELKGVKPNTVSQAPQWTVENFIGLRLIHFIGIIVLVIGLSIGVKYAIDRQLIAEGTRITLAYLAGIALYIISVRLKAKYAGFSAILFSGAMASLYFTTYGGHVYYQMFPFAIAFIIMVMLTIYTSYEALRYNRQEIALLGLVGAYGIPFLISKNAERADLLFVYITIINMGVVYLYMKKTWRWLGIAAQAITWLIFIGWASTRLQEVHKTTGIIFMLVFFFTFSFMLASIKTGKKLFLSNDMYQVVLNNIAVYIAALFVFGITSTQSYDRLAWITLLTSALVGLQSWLVFNTWKEEFYLARLLAVLSLILFVMFIGFYWNGFTVTFLWLFTAVIVFAWGFLRRSRNARMASIILIGATLAKLLLVDSIVFTTIQKVIAYLVLGVLLLVVSFFYQKFKKQLFSNETDANPGNS